MKNLLLVFSALLLGGCAASPEARFDPASSITTSDLNQAAFVRNVFAQERALDGKVVVTAEPRAIHVRFKEDLPEGKQALFTERMTHMKEIMRKEFGRPANRLVFEFPSLTLEL